MKIALIAALASLARTEDDGSFDAQAAIRALIEQTKAVKSKFELDSARIDSELQQVIGKPAKASLVQVASLASVQNEMKAFKKTRAALLEKDAKALDSHKKAYMTSMGKLRADSQRLLQHRTPSFLQLDGGDIDKFFAGPKAMIEKLHAVTQSIVNDKTNDVVSSPSSAGVAEPDVATLDVGDLD